MNSFLNFLADNMFTLKFWGNNYSEAEQNLLTGRKKGEVSIKILKNPSRRNFTLDCWLMKLAPCSQKHQNGQKIPPGNFTLDFWLMKLAPGRWITCFGNSVYREIGRGEKTFLIGIKENLCQRYEKKDYDVSDRCFWQPGSEYHNSSR